MPMEHLVLNDTTMPDVYLGAFPYASSPKMKRQTVDVPGANGVVDVTPFPVYGERDISVLACTPSDSRAATILAAQGSMVKLSTTGTWAGRFWYGRLSIPKNAKWGAEHRIMLELSADPYLMNTNPTQTPVVQATTAGAPITLTLNRQQVPEAVVTGTVQLVVNTSTGTRTYALNAGTHRLVGVSVGPSTPFSGVVKGTGTLRLRGLDGELWIG